jgi:sugar-specific transcriptional regulator TrmB/DNA-binding CsgD family transcriptional regulator
MSPNGEIGYAEAENYLSSLPDITPEMAQVYRYASSIPMWDIESAAGTFGWPLERAEQTVGQLFALGLIRHSPTDPSRFVAVMPEAAAAAILDGPQRQMADIQRRMERRRSEILALGAVYREAWQGQLSTTRSNVIYEAKSIGFLLGELSRDCRQELLSLQPGSGANAEVRKRENAVVPDALARGVRHRVILHHTTRVHLPTIAHVKELTRLGAEVKSVPELPDRMLIIDRATAVLPTRWNESRSGVVIVRDSEIVSFLVATFETLWSAGTSFEVVENSPQEVPDELRQVIVQLMASGYKDEAIAHRLGVSVRTCRRYIADLMAEMRASSRFQAGYLAAKAGRQQLSAADAARRPYGTGRPA